MNKIPCNVIKDLIVLYEDDACSAESRQLVEEHVKDCPDCRKLYEESTAPLPVIPEELTEQSELSTDEKAMHFLKKLKLNQDLRAIIILALAVTVIWLICTNYNFVSQIIVAPPAESVSVKEVYQMKDGSIFCTLESEKPFTSTRLFNLMVPSDKLDQSYSDGWYEFSLDTAWWRKLNPYQPQHHTASFVFPKASLSYISDDSTEREIIHESKAIYYIGKNKNDKLTVWKEGQKIEPAPESVEKLVANEYAKFPSLNDNPYGSPISIIHE